MVAAVWMRSPDEAPAAAAVGARRARPAIAGAAPEGDSDPETVAASSRIAVQPAERNIVHREVIAVAVVFAAATIVFGIYPEPLLDLANDAGASLSGLF